MSKPLNSGACVNGHPLPPFRLETLLGEDGQPLRVWVTECRALIIPAFSRAPRLTVCGARVYAELVPVEAAA